MGRHHLLCHLSCLVEHRGTENFKLFYFPNVMGLVQRIVRFVMRTEPKASYRTVQCEYVYHYTPKKDIEKTTKRLTAKPRDLLLHHCKKKSHTVTALLILDQLHSGFHLIGGFIFKLIA